MLFVCTTCFSAHIENAWIGDETHKYCNKNMLYKVPDTACISNVILAMIISTWNNILAHLACNSYILLHATTQYENECLLPTTL